MHHDDDRRSFHFGLSLTISFVGPNNIGEANQDSQPSNDLLAIQLSCLPPASRARWFVLLPLRRLRRRGTRYPLLCSAKQRRKGVQCARVCCWNSEEPACAGGRETVARLNLKLLLVCTYSILRVGSSTDGSGVDCFILDLAYPEPRHSFEAI